MNKNSVINRKKKKLLKVKTNKADLESLEKENYWAGNTKPGEANYVSCSRC